MPLTQTMIPEAWGPAGALALGIFSFAVWDPGAGEGQIQVLSSACAHSHFLGGCSRGSPSWYGGEGRQGEHLGVQTLGGDIRGAQEL